jgi:recombination protein RecA
VEEPLSFSAQCGWILEGLAKSRKLMATVTGSRTRLKIVKNKVAPPFTACEFDIMYNEGISKTGSVIDLGIEHQHSYQKRCLDLI